MLDRPDYYATPLRWISFPVALALRELAKFNSGFGQGRRPHRKSAIRSNPWRTSVIKSTPGKSTATQAISNCISSYDIQRAVADSRLPRHIVQARVAVARPIRASGDKKRRT